MRAVVLDEAGRPQLAEVPEPEGRRSACSPAGCAARTSRSSAPRTRAPSSATRSSRRRTARGSRSSTTRPAASAPLPGRARVHLRRVRRRDDPSRRFRRARPRGRRGRAAGRDRRRDRDDGRAARLRPARRRAHPARARARRRQRLRRAAVRGRPRRRGDEVFAVDTDPRRAGREPDGPVDTAILCAPGGADRGSAGARARRHAARLRGRRPDPGDAGLPARADRPGSRSATPRTWRRRALLPELDLPEPTVLPLERFAEGLELYRRGEALKVVFTP